MTKKTIPELDDGATTQTSAAEVAFSDGVSTFRGPIRPNPVNQINIRNQAQLEAELGVNLEIPDGETITIVVDDDFTLTTPIKLGNGSGLQLLESNIPHGITWTGTGAMIQNINPGVDESFFLFVENVNVVGDGTNSFVDITIESTGFSVLRGVNLSTFDAIGTINSPTVTIDSFSGFGITKGLVVTNSSLLNVNIMVMGNFSATNTTWLTVIPNVAARVTINNITASNSGAIGDSLIFFDPNSVTNTSFSISESRITDTVGSGEFYQLGTDIGINSVANNGSGQARFTTAASHGLVVGKAVVISDFVSNPNYNGTFIVTAVDTPLTGITFDVDVAFGTDEAVGMMNKSSSDQTDIEVFAENNNGTPDSTTIAESSINGTLEVDGSGGISVPIVDIASAPGDWIEDPSTERFTVDTETGLVTYIGVNTITAMIQYSLSASQTSGANQTVDFVLNINGSPQTKSAFTIITTGVGAPLGSVFNGGNFTISTGDTFQLFKDNTTNTTNTDITLTTLLINED